MTIRIGRKIVILFGLTIVLVHLACAESIPLKLDGGTYVVPVLINGKITLDFTVDSGAGEVSIPADVFGTLLRTETISNADLLEPGTYVLADGSTRRERRFRIRTLKVGNLELRNVVASVAPAQGNLLLGQSFLSRLRSWSFDNQRHMLVLNEGLAPGPLNEPDAHETATSAGRYTARSDTAEITPERYAAAQARCRANMGGSLCDELSSQDVISSEAAARTHPIQPALQTARFNAQRDALPDHQMKLDRLQRSLTCLRSHTYQECSSSFDTRAAADDVSSGRISQDEWFQVLKRVDQEWAARGQQ